MKNSVVLLAAALLAGWGASVGCAGASGHGGPDDPYHGADLEQELQVREGTSQRILFRSQLDDFPEMTLRDAIQRFRPRWIRPRQSLAGGGRPMFIYPKVWLDRTLYEDVSILERVRVWQIESVRYLNPHEATHRYGGGFPAGAIEILTRPD